ncbi:head-tail connector protein [Pararhizobium gei]|uniref:head-tail connector protein n=1 Tax=Pararhizobium gei TaxID=1395951 RepID=UPI0023DAE888|nr:head-tail connector protein [Rhizobium gei]
MTIIDIPRAKAQLNILDDQDDVLIGRKIAAAESFINRRLGFDMAVKYGDSDVPADLQEAILQLVAHWYENREAVLIGISSQALPSGLDDIIRDYRNWSFDVE